MLGQVVQTGDARPKGRLRPNVGGGAMTSKGLLVAGALALAALAPGAAERLRGGHGRPLQRERRTTPPSCPDSRAAPTSRG